MNNIKLSFAILAAALFAVSCQDFLVTVPEDGIGSNEMWTTKEHADLGIVGAYAPIKCFVYGSDPYSPPDAFPAMP